MRRICFPDTRRAWLLILGYGETHITETLDKQLHLCRLATSLGAFEGDEETAALPHRSQLSVIYKVQQCFEVFPCLPLCFLIVLP